jgi:putative ABC transport system ATP-binding protein
VARRSARQGCGAMTAESQPARPTPVVAMSDVHKTFGTGPAAVHALAGVALTAAPGELVALVGRSGSGKTTLLNIMGGLERPDAGTVHVAGKDLNALDDEGLNTLRRDSVAFVFQSFGLIDELSAAENVGLPLRLKGWEPAQRDSRVATLLDLVGLGSHADHRPTEMSGGQMQRVAIARALASSPRLLIADEPTGQLDTETGLAVMALIRAVVEAEGMTAVLSTHDPVMMALADRAVHIRDGHLVEG